MMGRARMKGFSLIEMLVSLLIFSIGLLGVGLQLARGMKATANNDIYANAMVVSSQAMEPLNAALKQGNNNLRTALRDFSKNSKKHNMKSSAVQQNFNVTIKSARDANNINLMAGAVGLWQPPYTVILNVQYQGGQNFETIQVMYP